MNAQCTSFAKITKTSHTLYIIRWKKEQIPQKNTVARKKTGTDFNLF